MDLLNNSEPALAFLVACFVKATVLLILVAFIMLALRNQSAALRHRVWAVGILSSLVLPVFTLLLPAWRSASLAGASERWSGHTMATKAGFNSLPAMIVNVSVDSPLSSKLAGIAVLIWMVGFFVVVLRLVVGLARLAWVSGHAEPQLREDWRHCVAEFCGGSECGRVQSRRASKEV